MAGLDPACLKRMWRFAPLETISRRLPPNHYRPFFPGANVFASLNISLLLR